MDKANFIQLLESAGNFKLRRAVERLREGLFDPFGVRLLTAHEAQLNSIFDHGVKPWRKMNPLTFVSAAPMARVNPIVLPIFVNGLWHRGSLPVRSTLIQGKFRFMTSGRFTMPW